MDQNSILQSVAPSDRSHSPPSCETKQPQVVPLYDQSPVNNPATKPSRHAVNPLPPTVAKLTRDLKSDKIVDAWDKIGIMTSQISQSVMQKQADLVAKRYQIASGRDANVSQDQGPSKKRRLESDLSSSNDAADSSLSSSSALPEQENWSESLARRVDRMANMSRLIMEIEYCHRLLRKEMVEVQADLCS
jgi:hypothetical protein